MVRTLRIITGVVGALSLAYLGIAGIIAAREKELRVSCKNRLRAIGVGLWNYQDVHKKLPPGALPNDKLPPEKRLSWYVVLAPYLEGKHPAGRIDKSLSWETENNLRVVPGR